MSEEAGAQATAPLPLTGPPHCRALSHRGTMPELRGSRLGERNCLRKKDAAHGTRHPHTHTHSVSPRIGPRESDTFRAENHSCLCTVLWTSETVRASCVSHTLPARPKSAQVRNHGGPQQQQQQRVCYPRSPGKSSGVLESQGNRTVGPARVSRLHKRSLSFTLQFKEKF